MAKVGSVLCPCPVRFPEVFHAIQFATQDIVVVRVTLCWAQWISATIYYQTN